jgi:NAD(P)-dependent dehydrogenase (short-subunit alcohol dehydrogenase family)
LDAVFGLHGRTALVTGSTAGIGRAIASKFLQAGCSVFVNGRSEESTAAAVEKLNGEGFEGKALAAHGDLSTAAGAESVFEQIAATGKEIDILVCNTGIYYPKPFEETTDEDWQGFFESNLFSTIRPCRIVLPKLLARNDHGRIIIVSSESSHKPLPAMIAYSTTKGAQITLARGLAELTKGTTVTVNSIMPGPTATEGVKSYFEKLGEQQGRPAEEVVTNYFREEEPTSLVQRLLDPEEIANTTLFLASKASSSVNGSSQRAEGGVYRSV